MADDRRADVPPGTTAGVLAARLKERICATITMIAVVVGLSSGDVGSRGAAATVLTTALGLWLAAYRRCDLPAPTTSRRMWAQRPYGMGALVPRPPSSGRSRGSCGRAVLT
ncbi:hypothetical protein [Streptomyces sp. NPDC001381]|uniref:hypothetical protein n=1 Tax=Streptomyces sp. NPDC001381 TaxID=3364567 RepID=UPI0036B84A65